MSPNSDDCKEEVAQMNRLALKYGEQGLKIFGLPTTDVLNTGKTLTYEQLFSELVNYQPKFEVIKPLDWNGKEMGEIFKYLKRYSPLFNVYVGKARRINQHFYKFLWDRYGILQKYYPPGTDYETIEKDILRLLEEKFDPEEYETIINPPEEIV